MKRRRGEPSDPIFAAEMAALEASRHAPDEEFQAAWAERLKRPTPPPVPPTAIHHHGESCFGDQAPDRRQTSVGWKVGRWCKTTRDFVVEDIEMAGPRRAR